MSGIKFDADYYERGLETGRSCYQNYRWMPELTIPLAMTIIDYLGIKRNSRILDFGCAKGYLVKALRLLYRDAHGVDTSKYAIENADPDVKDYCGTVDIPPLEYDYIIAKDVFEHIEITRLKKELEWLYNRSSKMFAIVPLGENKRYYSEKNNLDKSHIICEDSAWWTSFFAANKWYVKDFRYRIDGIKDSYYETTPKAHGFFTLQTK